MKLKLWQQRLFILVTSVLLASFLGWVFGQIGPVFGNTAFFVILCLGIIGALEMRVQP